MFKVRTIAAAAVIAAAPVLLPAAQALASTSASHGVSVSASSFKAAQGTTKAQDCDICSIPQPQCTTTCFTPPPQPTCTSTCTPAPACATSTCASGFDFDHGGFRDFDHGGFRDFHHGGFFDDFPPFLMQEAIFDHGGADLGRGVAELVGALLFPLTVIL